MKKFLSVFLACLLMLSVVAALPTAAAVDPMVSAFEELVWFETYKNNAVARPDGFPAAIVFDEMAEDYGWEVDVDWWADGAPDFVAVKQADFEAYVNVHTSPLFYTWLMNFGADVEIVAPVHVREEFVALAKDILKNYE